MQPSHRARLEHNGIARKRDLEGRIDRLKRSLADVNVPVAVGNNIYLLYVETPEQRDNSREKYRETQKPIHTQIYRDIERKKKEEKKEEKKRKRTRETEGRRRASREGVENLRDSHQIITFVAYVYKHSNVGILFRLNSKRTVLSTSVPYDGFNISIIHSNIRWPLQ